MTDMTSLISAAVAERMTPEFIEKEVNTRVDKLLIECIDRALRTYSETGKLIEKAVEDALRVDRIDLPSYGSIVTGMLKAQIEARVNEVVAGRLAADVEELLKLAPKEIKLSQIADEMRRRHEEDGKYGEVITVELGDSNYGSTWVYLDEDTHHERRAQYEAAVTLLLREDGTIASARLKEKALHETQWIGRCHGLDQMIRAYVACGTRIILDTDAVVTSVGDY